AAGFLVVDFFTAGFFAVAPAALFDDQRFFSAPTMAALPEALSLRFGFEATAFTGASDSSLEAHRFRCASPMRFRVAALIARRLDSCGSDAPTGAPPSNWRSSAI